MRKFNQKIVKEGRIVTVKRKYADRPAKTVQLITPVRNKILSFVSEKDVVSEDELKEFLKQFNEEHGRNTNIKWIKKNKNLFRITNENGIKCYRLSKYGRKVLNKTNMNESEFFFKIDEKKLIVLKRKYKDYPEKRISLITPVRQRILKFVDEKEKVTHEELQEFFKQFNEETGRNTTFKWFKVNSKLFKVVKEDGVRYFKLSKLGKKVLQKTELNENGVYIDNVIKENPEIEYTNLNETVWNTFNLNDNGIEEEDFNEFYEEEEFEDESEEEIDIPKEIDLTGEEIEKIISFINSKVSDEEEANFEELSKELDIPVHNLKYRIYRYAAFTLQEYKDVTINISGLEETFKDEINAFITKSQGKINSDKVVSLFANELDIDEKIVFNYIYLLAKYYLNKQLLESSFAPQYGSPQASPQNTPGMGNVRLPDADGTVGSGDKIGNKDDEDDEDTSKKYEFKKLKNIDEFKENVLEKKEKISKKFDKIITKYKEALVNKEKVMSEFVKKFKEETDLDKKQKMKEKHVEKMKKINDEIKELELDYNTVLQKMDISYDEE